jgi:hypothetical protein
MCKPTNDPPRLLPATRLKPRRLRSLLDRHSGRFYRRRIDVV